MRNTTFYENQVTGFSDLEIDHNHWFGSYIRFFDLEKKLEQKEIKEIYASICYAEDLKRAVENYLENINTVNLQQIIDIIGKIKDKEKELCQYSIPN